jgi:hypothetical protein
MENANLDQLAERFRKHLVFLKERLERLENLGAPPKTPASCLLRLPFEIRLQIYHYCIPRKRLVEVGSPYFIHQWYSEDHASTFEEDQDDDSEHNAAYPKDRAKLDGQVSRLDDCFWGSYWNKNSILRLSKQISEEALDVLYGDNIFKLRLEREEFDLETNFVEANIKRMRYLLLVAQPSHIYSDDKIPNDALWHSILPQLKILRIVAQQPPEDPRYSNANLEHDIEGWVNWLKPFLQCFGRHLSRRTIVEVDDDGREETAALVKKYLPDGYRKLQCHLVGDFVFKRGPYSWESGYWDDDDGPSGSWDADGDWASD